MGDIGSRQVRFEVLPASPSAGPARVAEQPARVPAVPPVMDVVADDAEPVGATARTEPARR